jgi:hypothetical protein
MKHSTKIILFAGAPAIVLGLLAGLRAVAADWSASAVAHALVRVVVAATTSRQQALKFQDTAPGAESEVTPPDAPNAAVVKITADSGRVLTLVLPQQVAMTWSGASDDTPPIYITDFTSNLGRSEVPTTREGLETRIGATRQSVSAAHPEGSYTGDFMATIAYP